MKLLLVIFGIFALMLFIIMIPAIEEKEYAKTHPEFLKDAYDLRNASITKIDTTTLKTTKTDNNENP